MREREFRRGLMRFPSWHDFTDAYEHFEQKVKGSIREFKQNHPLLDSAIKQSIHLLPPPFNAIAHRIYNDSEGSIEEKYKKVLNYLKDLQSQGEAHYNQITLKLDNLLIKVDDVQRLTAKESTLLKIQELLICKEDVINEKLDDIKEDIDLIVGKLEKMDRDLREKDLSEIGLHLITSDTEFGEGNRNAWVQGFFTLTDVKCGYAVRRPITDEIVKAIEKRTGVILYGPSHSGKSMIIKRIIFEMREKGYAILYSEHITVKIANTTIISDSR